VRAWLLLAARLWGCRTLADVIGVLTQRSMARYLGALPVLYLLLEQLQVRTIINRYCPTEVRSITVPWRSSLSSIVSSHRARCIA
jgi:hypothetical protein